MTHAESSVIINKKLKKALECMVWELRFEIVGESQLIWEIFPPSSIDNLILEFSWNRELSLSF